MFNLFVTDDHDYVRDINPLANYVKLTSYYISKCTGKPLDVATKWVRDKMKSQDPSICPPPPQIKFLSRDNGPDRQVMYSSLTQYIGYVINNKRIIAPSGTTYKPPSEELSLFTPYVNSGRANRAVEKKKAHEARLAMDQDKYEFHNELQNNAKIDNNSLSGSEQSPSTIIHTESAHPSLTSTTRVTTSIANAVNEKLIRNNRLYNSYDECRDNLVVMSYTTNKELVREVIDTMGLYIPTDDDILDVIYNSSKYYSIGRRHLEPLRRFISNMTDEERCNFVYNGSFWGVIEYNPELARQILTELIHPADTPLSVEESDKVLKEVYGTLNILAVALCDEHTKGLSIHKCKTDRPEVYGLVAATVVKINKTLESRKAFWEAFFKVSCLPGNIYDIESMYRRCVVTSDTDSTNYTTQEISKFYTGTYAHTPVDRHINFVITYISGMILTQSHGIMSCNLGVPVERIREIEMKNEFYTPIHLLTPSAKNYIMLQGAQEGNMLPKLDLVTKGVELRSSKIPKELLDIFEEYKENIFLRIERGEKLTMKDVLTTPVTVEHMVRNSIQRGETRYLPSEFIKTPDAYSNEEEARQWKYHLFYEKVFASTYGTPEYVPYMAYVVTVNLSKKKQMKEFVDKLPASEVKTQLEQYLSDNKDYTMTMVSLPHNVFTGKTIPSEIMDVIDVDSMTMRVVSNWYLLLESFGIYLRNKYNSKMMSNIFSDYVDPDESGRYLKEVDIVMAT